MAKGIFEELLGGVVEEVKRGAARVAGGAIDGAIREGQEVVRSIDRKLEGARRRKPETDDEGRPIIEVSAVEKKPSGRGSKRCVDDFE